MRTPFLTGLLLVSAAAWAQVPGAAKPGETYRCVGKDGKKYYQSTVPRECIGQPMEVLNAQGMVVRRFDAQASAAERAKKQEEDEQAKKRAAISKEEGRRNRALLATYTSEKDIDNARARALKDNEFSVKDIEKKIALMKQKIADTQKEMKASADKKQPTDKHVQTIKNTEFDIKTQEQLLATKLREVDSINQRYDEDKKRYRELTQGASK